jgi:hypothetical protein
LTRVKAPALVLGVVLATAVGVAIADMGAPGIVQIGPGSFGIDPQVEGLDVLPAEQGCEEPSPDAQDPCPRRYAYRPDGTVTAWVSVRNDGPLPVTLSGVSRRWLDQYPELNLLGRPVVGIDGGDPRTGGPTLPITPFQPVVLNADDERAVGLEFRTTNDVAQACANWEEGNGVQWDFVRIAWHWLFTEHEQELQFAEPITFMAPTASDCTRLSTRP